MDLMMIIFFVSLFIIAAGVLVKKLQNIFLTEPMLAMLAGVLFGATGLDIISSGDSSENHHILELAAKFTIAMALMATAIRIPHDLFRKNYTSLSVIVIAGMMLMWLLSSFLLFWVLEDFSFVECLLFGAIITPTDPVVASTIVTGEKAIKYLPDSVRNTLSFEAGINDGLAFPIVMLAIFLFNTDNFPMGEWVFQTVLYENILSAVIAFAVGYIAGIILHKAHKSGIMNIKAVLPFSIALAFLLLSGLELLGMNGIIGVFVGGMAFQWHIGKNEEVKEERVQETMERLFIIPVFFLFGLMIPWEEWKELGWAAISIGILILLFRRIPVFLLMIPFLPKFRGKIYDVIIMGWFGPIGVAALFYAIMAKDKTGMEDVWVIVSLVVFASTIIHGFTSTPFEKLYYSKTKKKTSSSQPEE